MRRAKRAGYFYSISAKSKGITKGIWRAKRAGDFRGVLFAKKYIGNAKEIRRAKRAGDFWGVFLQNIDEIQMKSGAQSAPGNFLG